MRSCPAPLREQVIPSGGSPSLSNMCSTATCERPAPLGDESHESDDELCASTDPAASLEPIPFHDPRSEGRLADLEREICELAAHLAAATCRWLLLVAEFDEQLGWAEWGVHSCAQWLSWRCSIGLCAAREHVRVGRRLGELPLVRERFASGQLSYSKVRAITRIATPETEADLVELAHHATGSQVEKLVRGYRGALAATLGSARRAHELRHLSWRWDDDGSLHFHGRVPADEGALLLAALRGAEEQAVSSTDAEVTSADDSAESSGIEPAFSDPASAGAQRADALISIARASLADGAAERSGGDPCELVVHVDAETLVADEVRSKSELDEGPALAPETVRRLGCDTAVVGIVERDGRPLSVGRRTRTIPPAIRRALRSRDRGCRFPGCTHTRFIHAHHIRHWARGGATALDNLVQLCSYHHRLVHEGGFAVESAGPDCLRFRRPDGRLIPAINHARCRGPGLEERHRKLGLAVDADTCRSLSAGDPMDYGIAVECLLIRVLGPG